MYLYRLVYFLGIVLALVGPLAGDENEGTVTLKKKRLVAYITSAHKGCRYCEAHTILAAERYGGTEQRLADI